MERTNITLLLDKVKVLLSRCESRKELLHEHLALLKQAKEQIEAKELSNDASQNWVAQMNSFLEDQGNWIELKLEWFEETVQLVEAITSKIEERTVADEQGAVEKVQLDQLKNLSKTDPQQARLELIDLLSRINSG